MVDGGGKVAKKGRLPGYKGAAAADVDRGIAAAWVAKTGRVAKEGGIFGGEKGEFPATEGAVENEGFTGEMLREPGIFGESFRLDKN